MAVVSSHGTQKSSAYVASPVPYTVRARVGAVVGMYTCCGLAGALAVRVVLDGLTTCAHRARKLILPPVPRLQGRGQPTVGK